MRRIMIAAPKSGSGKTTITCALLKSLIKRGEKAVAFKCGPDYIDPMFHKKVLGVSSGNLDTFFTGEEETRRLLAKHAGRGEVAVLEGVMGLFDGLGGVREEGSSYHLAKVTGTPIVLVADVKGMGRSVLPLLAGFLAYDTEHLIKGVILNRISKGYYEILKPLIEKELPVPVLGFLAEQERLHLESRHLGLVLPDELADIQEKIDVIREEFERNVSVPAMLAIANGAGKLWGEGSPEGGKREEKGTEESPVIAVAMDEAFCFYYEENLLMLEERGAKIKYFSPLDDTKLPEGCCGLLLGGGYPELYGERLARNVEMRTRVKEAIENGMPTVAECGGFLYLHSALRDKSGKRYDMAGVISGECFDTGHTVRFGYVEIQDRKGHFLPKEEKIKGHEFHYYDSTDNGSDALAIKPTTGRSYPCVLEGENYWFGFPHLYYPSNPAFAASFVKKAEKYGGSG